jgi:hypothetical protein
VLDLWIKDYGLEGKPACLAGIVLLPPCKDMKYIGCQVGSRYNNYVHLLSAFVERSGRQKNVFSQPLREIIFSVKISGGSFKSEIVQSIVFIDFPEISVMTENVSVTSGDTESGLPCLPC